MSTPQYPGHLPDPYGQPAYPGQQQFPGADSYGQPVADPYAAPGYPSAPADPFAASPGYPPAPAEYAAPAPAHPAAPAEHAYGGAPANPYGGAPEYAQGASAYPPPDPSYPPADPYARPAYGVGLPAEPGRRVVAFLIDSLIAGGIAVVFGALAVVLTLTVDMAAGMIALLVMYAAVLAWFLVYTGMQGGSGSIGARAQKIRIVQADTGAPLGFGRALLRNIVLGATGTILLLGYFSILFDKSGRRQGWHDKAAGAMVVDARPAEQDPYGSPLDAYGAYQGETYGAAPSSAGEPYGAPHAGYAPEAPAAPAHDPYGAPANPYDGAADPYAAPADPYAGPVDPVATAAVTMDPSAAEADPYAPPPAAYAPPPAVPPRPADPVADASATAIPEPSAFSASNPPFPAAAPAAQPGASLISSVPGVPVAAPEPRETAPQRREPVPPPASDDFVDDTVIVQRHRPGAIKRAVFVWDDDIRHVVTSRTVFGRNPPPVEDAEVVAVRDTTLSLSKTHFAIDVDPTGAWLTDMHSTNGVVIVRHGDRVEVTPGLRTPLEPGDALEMGDRVVTFEALA
ncbi:RDD family protein [Microbacterium sp. NPDC003461]